MTRLEDLSDADRAAVRRALTGAQPRARHRPTRRQAAGAGFPIRCGAPGCEFTLPTYSDVRVARHQRETGHGRYECVLDQEETP